MHVRRWPVSIPPAARSARTTDFDRSGRAGASTRPDRRGTPAPGPAGRTPIRAMAQRPTPRRTRPQPARDRAQRRRSGTKRARSATAPRSRNLASFGRTETGIDDHVGRRQPRAHASPRAAAARPCSRGPTDAGDARVRGRFAAPISPFRKRVRVHRRASLPPEPTDPEPAPDDFGGVRALASTPRCAERWALAASASRAARGSRAPQERVFAGVGPVASTAPGSWLCLALLAESAGGGELDQEAAGVRDRDWCDRDSPVEQRG